MVDCVAGAGPGAGSWGPALPVPHPVVVMLVAVASHQDRICRDRIWVSAVRKLWGEYGFMR